MVKKDKNSDDAGSSDSGGSTFPSKLLSCIPDAFKAAAQGMSTEDLRKKLVEVERSLANTQKDMKNDPKLNGLKEDIKAFSEGYKELIGQNRASIAYILHILDSRGVAS